jgi:hypothetical protein
MHEISTLGRLPANLRRTLEELTDDELVIDALERAAVAE